MPEGKSAKKDAGAAEVQDRFDEESEQGFAGRKVDPLPNEAHSQESGPDSPTAQESRDALAKADAERGTGS